MVPQLTYTSPHELPRDRLMRLPEVRTVTGLTKSSIYLLMKRGDFPRNVSLGARCVAWPESHVLQWVQQRITGARETTQ
jgi:prophage regulatory protein